MLSDLQRDGYVITTADAIFGAERWREMQQTAQQVQFDSRQLIQFTRQARIDTRLQLPGFGPARGKSVKNTFLAKLLGDRPLYEPESIWVQAAEAPPFVELATAYLSKPPVLKAFNLWYTVPTKFAPRDSQLWHRDEDDVNILKLFAYFTDVDEAAGALTVIPGTQHGGPMLVRPQALLDYAHVPRVSDEEMATHVPSSAWVSLVGKAGTVVIVDTTCWHKGGYGVKDRYLFTSMFTTIPHPRKAAFVREAVRQVPGEATATPWQDTEDYTAYVRAQVDKTREHRRLISGSRVAQLVGMLVRSDPQSPKGRSVLAVGCRNSHELNTLWAAGFEPVTGIDLVQLEPTIQAMDMHRMTFADHTFDVLFSCHSLEHAYDVEACLQEWARVTKPGGTWVIETPVKFKVCDTDRQDAGSLDGLKAWLAPYVEAYYQATDSLDGTVVRIVAKVKA